MREIGGLQGLCDLLPYIAFYLIATCSFFDLSSFSKDVEQLIDCGKAIGLVLIGLSVLFDFRGLKYYVVCGAGVVMGLAAWRQTGTGYLFWTFAIAMSMRNADPKRLALASMAAVVTAALVLQIALAVTGMPEYIVQRTNGEVRRSFGFQHPNIVGMLATTFAAGAFLRFWDKNRLLAVALCALPVFPVILADSRTGLIGLALFCVASVLLKNPDAKPYRLLKSIAPFALVVCVGLSLFSMLFYAGDNSLIAGINKLLSGRLRLNNYYFEMYGLSPFGRRFDAPSGIWNDGMEVAFLVDNAYCRLLIEYGVIAAVIFGVYQVLALIGWSLKEDRSGICIAAVVYVVIGLVEHMMFDPAFNISLLFMPASIYLLLDKTCNANADEDSSKDKRDVES